MPAPLLALSNALSSAGTAELVASGAPLVQWCVIKASHDNTGYIYIGGVTVSATVARFALRPGEERPIEYEEGILLNALYFDGDTTGNRIDVLYPGESLA